MGKWIDSGDKYQFVIVPQVEFDQTVNDELCTATVALFHQDSLVYANTFINFKGLGLTRRQVVRADLEAWDKLVQLRKHYSLSLV